VESLIWGFRTLDPLLLATPVLLNLALLFALTQFDFVLLLSVRLIRTALGIADSFRPLGPGERPAGLVIIPSLLRNADDLRAITTTVESAATNGYPGDLFVVASVDGRRDFPALYAELLAWGRGRGYPANVRLCITGTPTRLGKMMAVEAGVQHVRAMVARGEYPRFPEIYFSVDGDGTLGTRALERLAHQLGRRNPLTGDVRRIVSGKICVRRDLFWRGWRPFFSVAGQLYLLAAREFLVSNVSRFNWKWTPRIGVPGALYCTWSELLLQAPYFMSFMKTIRARDWLRWWLGFAPPMFSTSPRRSLPDALTGASDDTCMAFLASLASFRGGVFCLDAPRSPLHAFGRMLRAYLFDRSHHYEPEARVYTYTPPTLRGLWRQRVRWNSSRVECAGRFSRAFAFHWEIGIPTGAHLWNLLGTVFEIVGYYVVIPYYVLGEANALLAYLLGYTAQTLAYALYTLMALALEVERRSYLPVLLCLPIASLYQICMNAFGCVYGVTRDVLLFGNATNFAPEWTLKRGGCVRIALLFRVRRFLALCVRSLVHGDVPFGGFWFGWRETPWTPSGFEGWTTGRKPPPIVPREQFQARLAAWKPSLRLALTALAALGLASAAIDAVIVRPAPAAGGVRVSAAAVALGAGDDARRR
jgi:hypothetical protein